MNAIPQTTGDALGLWLGYFLGPVFGVATLLRGARAFHPGGVVYLGTSKPSLDVKPDYFDLAKNLSGGVVVRFSSSTWKKETILPDALGCSIRFRVGKAPHVNLEEGAQDLILVSSPKLEQLPLYMIKTNQHDFLANIYYSAAPYQVAGHSHCKLRVIPTPTPSKGRTRNEKLADAVANGEVRLQLEVAEEDFPHIWLPIAEIKLERAHQCTKPLTFSPFRAQLGIQPQGFINYLREGPYMFSEFVRIKRAQSHGNQHSSSNKIAALPQPESASRKKKRSTEAESNQIGETHKTSS